MLATTQHDMEVCWVAGHCHGSGPGLLLPAAARWTCTLQGKARTSPFALATYSTGAGTPAQKGPGKHSQRAGGLPAALRGEAGKEVTSNNKKALI